MRFVAVGMLPLLLASCGAKYKPADPVLTDYERAFKFPVHRPHEGLAYTGRNPGTVAPVIPVIAFGAAFDLDYVVMPSEGDFEMIEFGKLALPTGPEWIVLETSAASGDQTMISSAALDELPTMMPEIPVARQVGDLVVTDKSTEFALETVFTYTNSKGQKVEAELAGDPPTKAAKRRNGNTFDHSANQLMAVLDIPSTESLFTANLKVDGNGLRMQKIGAIVPAQFAMVQAMGGMAMGAFKIVPGEAAAGGPELGTVVLNRPGEQSTVKASPEMMVRMAVAQNSDGIRTCWNERSAAAPELKGGVMTFEFDVTNGVVSNAAPTLDTSPEAFVDEALTTCVNGVITGWALDSEVTGRVSWPFTFVAGDVDADLEPSLTLGMGSFTSPDAAPMATDDGITATPASVPGSVDELLGEDMTTVGSRPATTLALNDFTTVHSVAGGATVELKWLVTRQGDRVTAKQTTDVRSLEYEFRVVRDAYLELVAITVEQYGRATPVTSITFNPPIPDLRWPFNGKRTSNFVVDVNGQQSHAYGDAEAYWTESGPKVRVVATEPEWAKARPLVTSVTFVQDGTADVKVERTGE